MTNHNRWTVESAQKATEKGALRKWLVNYLKNEGNNLKLAQTVEESTDKMKIEPPKMMLLSRMKIMVGPPGSKRKWIDKDWGKNIEKFVKLIESGWSPPPIIVTDFWKPGISITDGNHRYEALKKIGYKKYWAIQLRNKNKITDLESSPAQGSG